jgi:hypothetical protein
MTPINCGVGKVFIERPKDLKKSGQQIEALTK